MTKRFVGVNDQGLRVGQDHQNAKLTDAEVELLLRLRAEDRAFWSYRRLAEKFEVSKSAVRDYVTGRRRGQVAIEFRVVRVPG